MTAGRDQELRIQAYLQDGPTELPDRSYYAVRAQIDQTRQRVVFGPWRETQMLNFPRLAIAGAIVLVIAVIGYNLLPGLGGGGGPGSAPSPSPSPTPGAVSTPSVTPAPTVTPSPSASPSPGANRLPPGSGPLDPGTYYIDDQAHAGGVRISFDIPAGWETVDYGSIEKNPDDPGWNEDDPGKVVFSPWTLTHIFSDACQWDEQALVDVGTTVDELISALADQGGHDASEPMAVELGGYPATRIDLTVPADLDLETCNEVIRHWPGPGPDFSDGLAGDPPGNTDEVYVVDVDGTRLVIVARHYPESPDQNRAELQAILDSIEFEP